MATRRAAKSARRAAKSPPEKYLEKVLFREDCVRGKDFQQDNMVDLSPVCIHNLDEYEVYAVYQFVGLQKVKTTVTFEEVKA